jgi:hypothetical protein
MNIDERIRQLGELIDAMPIQKSPTRMAFEANYEKIEASLAKGNSIESICKFFLQLDFVIAQSTLRQYLREERAKRKTVVAEVKEETSATKGDEKSKKKRKENAGAALKADSKPQTGAEESPAKSAPPVQPSLPETRPQPGKIQKVF